MRHRDCTELKNLARWCYFNFAPAIMLKQRDFKEKSRVMLLNQC